jgi:hypothetical protein
VQFDLDHDGLALLSGLLNPDELRAVERLLPNSDASAGIRIFGNGTLSEWLTDGPIAPVICSSLGPAARPVRAILFDKTVEANWALGWHQDRTIAVRKRIDVAGFGRWTTKSGVPHAEPPFSIIEKMLTARIHLDPVNGDNAPLLVVPGSHRFGRISEAEIDGVVEGCGAATCLANRGDVWLYRTAILHASASSRSKSRRRVLQVDFSSDELPDGLEWLGVA